MPTNRSLIYLELAAFLLALALIAWLAATSSHTSNERVNEAIAGAEVGTNARQLKRRLELLSVEADNYVSGAPRNYDAFFRDTQVLHPNLLAHIESLDQAVRRLADRNHSGSSSTLAELASAWEKFRSGLNEQLGVDPDVPRLEWGFEHIDQQLSPVQEPLDRLIETTRAEQAPTGTGSNGVLSIGLPAWALAFVGWFVLRTRP